MSQFPIDIAEYDDLTEVLLYKFLLTCLTNRAWVELGANARVGVAVRLACSGVLARIGKAGIIYCLVATI